MTIERLTPMLAARDIRQTIAFYVDVLGFEVVDVLEDDGVQHWCYVRNGGADLMFDWSPPHDHDDGEVHSHEPELTGTLYFYPDDIAVLYERVKDNASVISPLQDTPYRMREFRMVDPNGYVLSFGAPLS